MIEPRILIAEDDHELRGVLVRGLREEGFRAEGVSTGADLLGRVGDTGDARGGITHLHFERHPNGGPAVDPAPRLVLACLACQLVSAPWSRDAARDTAGDQVVH